MTTVIEQSPLLSVVIPVDNELGTIGRALVQVSTAVPGVAKQIIIVDDRSSDGTTEWLTRNLGQATGVWRSIG